MKAPNRGQARRRATRNVVALMVLVALSSVAPRPSRAQEDVAKRAQGLIVQLDLDEARAVLAAAGAADPRVAIERARLAIYELDCDGAAAILAAEDVQKLAEAESLADIARGCQRVTAALVVDKDDALGIEVRWQDEHDRALAPLLFATVAQAREALSRDLAVDWPRPTRVVVVRDLLSLSAMTGLPYSSAQTTGAAAVAKWGRINLLSPRASRHGLPWRDVIAHELTHLAITRASGDRAPLWLQEGVAKREEVRWRDPGPFDDRPPPDSIAQRGLELGLGLPLDKLGPSIAMLPSADAALVAFAEVTSFVRFFVQSEGEGAVPSLLREMKDGLDSDAALVAVSGAGLAAWDGRWRQQLRSRPAGAVPALLGLGSTEGEADKLRDLRERSRLADLLLSRGHAAEAVRELDRIKLARSPVGPNAWGAAMGDPSLRWLRGRALELADRREEGEPLMSDPGQVVSAYGPWWAVRARWARLRGDETTAAQSFVEAVAADPLEPEAACETIDPNAVPADLPKRALCAAARARGEPPFGGD
jgi:hypothetical protein